MEYLAFMKTKILLLCIPLFLLVFFLSSCGNCSKKIDCPGFNDSLLTALFPYTDNQQIVFKTNTNEQAVFHLKNTKTTTAYQAVGGIGRAPYCSAEKIFESQEKGSTGQPLFSIDLVAEAFRRAVFTINESNIEFQSFSDTLFQIVTINGPAAAIQRMPSLVLGNRTFNNVVTATRDTTLGKVTGVYKIWYTKTEGIVGYADYSSLKTWVKQ